MGYLELEYITKSYNLTGGLDCLTDLRSTVGSLLTVRLVSPAFSARELSPFSDRASV
jgi:hypothetical protein